MSKSTSISSIPTLSQLFKNGKLNHNPSQNAYKVASKVSLWQGDITTLSIDAIVNAANESLLGGGGVDGAIHRAAGPSLLKECKTLKGCDTGDAKITKGYDLPSKHVIHTVGPIYSKSDPEKSEEELRSAYRRCLEEAEKADLKTIAFPSISTGVYRFPIDKATEISTETIGKYLSESKSDFERVIFCVHSDRDLQVYEETVGQVFDD